ncbi:MAG TPA: nucleoside-diphosphate sugar epimerase/dehydratase [Burkholderiaceae bacterium]|nr:nucleoside-diphosphate sugar epimerase/dehydratase [Burkholderiaceae bacterium]
MSNAAIDPAGLTFWHRLDRFLARLRTRRSVFTLAVDAVVVALAWHATYLFRLGFERWQTQRPSYDNEVLLGVVAIYILTFVVLRVPQSMWRFAGFGEVKRLTIACAAAGLAAGLAVRGLELEKVPRAVLALHPVVTLMGVILVRILYRMVYEHARTRITGGDAEIRRAIVLGAGDAARRLLAGIHQQGWIVLGLLDDDPALVGVRLAGVPVLGPLSALASPDVIGGAKYLILAMPEAPASRRREVLALASGTGLPVLTVPGEEELREGVQAQRVREIVPEDLLGRAPVVLDDTGVAATLAGKAVMITGAGGSIGAELCRQVARFQPSRLVLFEASEFNLYSVEQELSAAFPALELVRLLGDVKDAARLAEVFAAWRPAVVFHAAAYKHVPLVERDNAWTALQNNFVGTWQVGLAAARAGAERFVLISTDKAVNPANVMGATKRAAEMVVSDLAAAHPATRFMAVRFGNVLGSSGSVIPKFKEQIARGGPVTVTHADIIRYFMTVSEAARLVLQAAAIGESGQVLVLDMGEPVRIVDLARAMIRLAGHAEGEIEIVYSGLRPGEKLYEELLADADATLPTHVPRIHVARIASNAERVPAMLAWAAQHPAASDAQVQAFLAESVAEYRPAEADASAAR